MRGLTHNERLLLSSPWMSSVELRETGPRPTCEQLAMDGRVVIHRRLDDEHGHPVSFHYTITALGRLAIRLDQTLHLLESEP